MKLKFIMLLTISTLIIPGYALAGKITVKGSDTMIVLAQRWAEEYMKIKPDARIQVTGGGSGTGIAALINGTTDIANASREMKPSEITQAQNETGQIPFHFQVAMDALSVVTNSANSIQELTLKQILGIYTGQINNWSEVGGGNAPIVRYCRESNSGTYVFFKEHVLKNMDYAADCQTMPGTSAVADAVSRDPNGIGYGGVGYFLTRSDTKVLSLKKDENTPAVNPVKNGKIDFSVVYSGEYPIARYLHCYTLGNPTGEIKEYLEWTLGDQGQKIAEEVGYIPLPA